MEQWTTVQGQEEALAMIDMICVLIRVMVS